MLYDKTKFLPVPVATTVPVATNRILAPPLTTNRALATEQMEQIKL